MVDGYTFAGLVSLQQSFSARPNSEIAVSLRKASINQAALGLFENEVHTNIIKAC
jgi:hypothetical protein